MKERTERRIAIVGFWDVTRDLAYSDPHWASAEHWSLNHNWPYLKGGWDRWIDIHDPAWSAAGGLKAEVWAEQDEWLRRKHGKPIYMQRHHPEYPDSVPYPIDEIAAQFGRRYFTSAVAYLIAMALYEGCTELGVFGADMRHAEEYATQRPCAEYWLGRAESMGVQLYIPPAAGLLNPDGDYGYSESNSAWIEMRRALEDRIVAARADEHKYGAVQAAAEGRRTLLKTLLNGGCPDPGGLSAPLREGLEKLLGEADGEYHDALAHRYAFDGIIQDNVEWLRRIDQRRRGGGVL